MATSISGCRITRGSGEISLPHSRMLKSTIFLTAGVAVSGRTWIRCMRHESLSHAFPGKDILRRDDTYIQSGNNSLNHPEFAESWTNVSPTELV